MSERNHEVIKNQQLLDKQGNITEPGWSRRQLQQYSRAQIKAPKFRIKEWDYYLVVGDDCAVAFTLSDDGYVGLQSVSLLDFSEEPWEHTETILDAFPMGKLTMPENSSEGNIVYEKKNLRLSYVLENSMSGLSDTEGPGSDEKITKQNITKQSIRIRHITCQFDNFYQGKSFSCDIRLRQPDMDTMVIATPWEKKGRFYYNQKINCMRAEGYAEYDGKRYEFHPDRHFGTLDWGRGVWTYDNTWYWGSGKYLPNSSIRYDTNFTDEVLSTEWNESELENDDLKNYKAKAEYYIRQHQDNIAIAKLKRNKPLTSTDIAMLEEVLWSEVGTKQDYEQEFGEKPLGEFVREIVGLDMNAAKEAFSEYLTNASLDSRQIYFVNQIVEYIVHNGMMKDLSVLQESPFTDRGSVVEIFTDLSVWMGIRKVIDMINANAVA